MKLKITFNLLDHMAGHSVHLQYLTMHACRKQKQIFMCKIHEVSFNLVFLCLDEEQQENSHPRQRGEHQEEAVSGLQAEHGQAAQTGDVRRHQEEV